MLKEKFLKKLVLVLFLTILSSMVGVLVWGANRGIDFSDEGLYLFLIEHWLGQGDNLSSAANLSVQPLRLLRLFLTIASSIYFSWCFYYWAKSKSWFSWLNPSFWLTALFLLSGTLLSYSLFPQTLSYNSLTQIFGSIIAGSLVHLFTLNENRTYNRYYYILCAGLGLLVAFEFFVKFPGGILFAIASTMALLSMSIFFNQPRGVLLKAGASILGGLVLAFVIYEVFMVGLSAHLEAIQGVLSMGAEERYGIIDMLNDYGHSIMAALNFAVGKHLVIVAISCALFALPLLKGVLNERNRKYGVIGLSLLLAVSLVKVVLDYRWFKSGSGNLYDAPLVYILLVVVLGGIPLIAFLIQRFKQPLGKDSRNVVAVIATLLILLFSSSIGTNNNLTIHLIQYLYLLFAVLIMCFALIGRLLQNRTVPILFMVLVFGISVSQTFTGYVSYPYRITSSLTDQNKPIGDGFVDPDIRVDERTWAYVDGINRTLLERTVFAKGDGVINMINQAGLTYLLGGHSPGLGWFKTGASGRNCNNLKLHPISNPSRTIVIKLEMDTLSSEFVHCLQESGITYPGNYELTVTIPALSPSNGQEAVQVWVPKNMLR